MKKAVFAAVVLFFVCCVSSSFAMTIHMETAGVAVLLPPNSRVEALSDGNKICTFQAYLKDHDDSVFVYLFGCIDELEGRGFADMSDDEKDGISISLASDMGVGADDLHTEIAEFNGMPYMLIRNLSGDLLLFYTIQNGWVYVVGTARLSREALSEEDLQLLRALTAGLSFD